MGAVIADDVPVAEDFAAPKSVYKYCKVSANRVLRAYINPPPNSQAKFERPFEFKFKFWLGQESPGSLSLSL